MYWWEPGIGEWWYKAGRRFLAHTGAFRLAGRLGLIEPPGGAQRFSLDDREMALALGYGASHPS